MDLSIIAVVGSFMVSERILKPKTLVMVALTGLLSYDLMTKTHDPASLRVYRGPGLLAFALMCAAYPLRTWRRNGVACDELIFLPGTKHGAQTYASLSTLEYFQSRRADAIRGSDVDNDDDDDGCEMGVIVSHSSTNKDLDTINTYKTKREHSSTDIEEEYSSASCILRQRVDSTSSIIDDDNDHDHDVNNNNNNNNTPVSEHQPSNNNLTSTEQQQQHNNTYFNNTLHLTESWEEDLEDEHDENDTTQYNYAYAPSATSVLGGGLDLMIPVLFNFHLFTEATAHYNRQPQNNNNEESSSTRTQKHPSDPSPKILPLLFLTTLVVRAIIPPARRRRFWRTLRYTIVAPLYSVSFRDAFMGDILTSLSRPIQDIAFAIFYYIAVLRGLVTQEYKLDDVGDLLEHNSTLHNWVLPACAVLPLWFKYMQCIRLVYDSNLRWPHLGNACKYLSAALITTYAMAHPKTHRGVWWTLMFAICTLYQIWWDTVMDWKLFTYIPKSKLEDDQSSATTAKASDAGESDTSFLLSSSSSPSSSLPSSGNYHDYTQRMLMGFFSLRHRAALIWNGTSLRSKRLYKRDLFYWRVFWINAALRFCWMLNFIPAHRVSTTTGEILQTFSSDVHTYLGPIISAAEVIRRCLWCIVLVEVETIKITDPYYSHESGNDANLRHDIDRATSTASMNSEDKCFVDIRALCSRMAVFLCLRSSWLTNNISPSVIKKLRIVEASCWGVLFIGLVCITVFRL